MTTPKTYIAALAVGLALLISNSSWAYTENQWNDSVHTYGPWDASLHTAGGGYGARGFQYQAFANPEYLTDRNFLENLSNNICPAGTLCGFSTYEVVRTSQEQGSEQVALLFGNEPSRVMATTSSEVDESFLNWLQDFPAANGTFTTTFATTTDSADHPDLGPSPIPAFYWNILDMSIISAQGSAADSSESRDLWITALAYLGDSGIEFVYGYWDDFYSYTDEANTLFTTDRHGTFAAGKQTPADTISSLKLNAITAQYSGFAFSTGAPVSWQSVGGNTATPNLTTTPFDATVNFTTGDVQVILNGGLDSAVSTFADSRGITYAAEGIGYTMNGSLNPAGGADFSLTDFTAPDGIVTGSGEGSLFGGEAQFLGGISDVVKTTDEYTARHVAVMKGDKL
jgi:hypothetical protein